MRAPFLVRGARPPQDEKALRDQRRRQRKEELASRRAALKAAKQQAETERALRKQDTEARRQAETRTLEAIAAKAFEHYLHVRERARRMREASDGAPPSLTDAEQRMVAALAPLWEADPETIAGLRRWGEPTSGVRAADYDDSSSQLTLHLKRTLHLMRRRVGGELFVQEPAALGGFGCNRRGERYNEDTLKFFNALVALQDGAVLSECRDATRRRVVWEIGGGWGGFAYQFKTLCPNVTYVITGFPDQFLVSAVYLMALFPGARCRFYDGSSPADVWHDWENVDFVFAPEHALPALRPPRVDLVLDIMALRNMDAARLGAHVQRAFELGARYVYSLRLSASSADDERVWRTLERLYWLHPIPARGDTDLALLAVEPGTMPESDYGHLVGWRRMRV